MEGNEDFGHTILQSNEGILGRRFGIYIDYRNPALAFINHCYDPDYDSLHLGRKRSVKQCETLCEKHYREFAKKLLPYLSEDNIKKLFLIKQPNPVLYSIDNSLSLKEEMNTFISKLKTLKDSSKGKELSPKFSRVTHLIRDYAWLIIDEKSCNWIFDILFSSKKELDNLIEKAKVKKGGYIEITKGYKKELLIRHREGIKEGR